MVVERVDDEAVSERGLDQESADALSAWHATVCKLPAWAHDARRARELEQLVQWYACTWNAPQGTEPAPQAGLDALTDELTDPRCHRRLPEISRSRWAIRVAEELVSWRVARIGNDPRTRVNTRVAQSRLVLALRTARGQFGDEEGGSTFQP